MANWLLKTEPSMYSFANLVEDERTMWDGVKNSQALNYLRAMHDGDRVLIYHSGDIPAIVGTGTVEGEPYPDPEANDPKATVINVRADRAAPKMVPLSAIRGEPLFADNPLVRQPRLGVMPITDEQWRRVLEMGGLDEGA